MNSFSHASSLLLAAACSMMISPVAFAQATVLTGQVATIGHVQPMMPAQPVYDNTPSYGTTYVNVNPKANLRSGAYQSGAYQNYRAPRPVVHEVYVRDNRTFFQRHPMVKSATIGAGVGAAGGAITGAITGRGIGRGALIGAGAGAGVGVVRSSQIMRRHPIVRDVATGSLVGLGLGLAGGRMHGTAARATGVGAAVGLGVGLFKHLR